MKDMKTYTFLLSLLMPVFLQSQQSLNVELFGQVQRSDARYSGSWSYIAPDGSEYALIGAASGTAAYCIDDSTSITELGFVPGPMSNWREIVTIGDYAYVTTEGSGQGQGMQVIDLQYLPDSISLLTTYDATFTRGHILQRDIYSNAPYVYVNGTTSTQGVHILDVSDPANPVEVGLYNPGYYIHDCHVNGDLLFAAAFYESKVDVLDISDKSNPTLIADFIDPNGNTHSSWLTEDKSHLILASELDGTPGQVYNVEDITDPQLVATYSANLASLVHNPYVRGDYVFISHNTEGLRVLDIKDPTLPVEVGYYDTFSGPSGGFFGLWSACPYFPSGKIIGGNRTDGLYVWTFNNAKAGRIYGKVLDGFTGDPIPEAVVVMDGLNDTLSLDLGANFKFGALPGGYTISVSAEGYYDASVSVELKEGDQQMLVIELIYPLSSTHETSLKDPLLFQPNPCESTCLLPLQNYPDAALFELYDVSGKLVYQEQLADRDQLTLDHSNTSSGLFFFLIKDKQDAVLNRGKVFLNP